jgi:hypothetical protein
MAIGASLDSPRTFMTWQDYEASRQAVEVQARKDLAGCRGLDGGDKTVCRTGARAADRVRRAELEARYRGTVASESEVSLAKIRGTFEVARARCQARADADRISCLGEARAAHARATAAIPST